jgi:hypothetical protein
MALGLRRRGPPDAAVGIQPAGDQISEDLAHPAAEQSHTRSRADGPDAPASSAESASQGS